jgi:hypothetical protein
MCRAAVKVSRGESGNALDPADALQRLALPAQLYGLQ